MRVHQMNGREPTKKWLVLWGRNGEGARANPWVQTMGLRGRAREPKQCWVPPHGHSPHDQAHQSASANKTTMWAKQLGPTRSMSDTEERTKKKKKARSTYVVEWAIKTGKRSGEGARANPWEQTMG